MNRATSALHYFLTEFWHLGTTASQHQTNSNIGMIETDMLTISHFLHALLTDMYDELQAPSV